MASRGSVIPLFIEQIKAGQPLTVTDPNMTRFLMSLEEAVELVVFASKCTNLLKKNYLMLIMKLK